MPETIKDNTVKKAVLVIEDDQALVQAYQIKLKKEGAEVWVARDGREALNFLDKADTPGIVLLDLMLPDKSGFEVLEQMRQNERWKKVPVIVVSNLGQQQDIDRVKQFGVEEYLVKANIRIADVVAKVKKYIQ